MTDCAGRAPRSTWIQPSPSPRVSVRAHRRTSFAPKAELGTSGTMLHTCLSAKKSSPVNCKLFFAPSTSQKKGSLRQPAKKRVSPASITLASRPIDTGAPSTISRPRLPVPAACGPSTRRRIAVCAPPSKGEKLNRYAISATASPSVSIFSSYNASGAKGSVVVGPGGFSPADGWTFIIRMDFPVSPGLGKAYRSVKSSRASPLGKAEVRARVMMRHGLVLLLQFLLCSAWLERRGTGRGDGMILIAGTTADANRPYHLAIAFQRDAASEDHDLAII